MRCAFSGRPPRHPSVRRALQRGDRAGAGQRRSIERCRRAWRLPPHGLRHGQRTSLRSRRRAQPRAALPGGRGSTPPSLWPSANSESGVFSVRCIEGCVSHASAGSRGRQLPHAGRFRHARRTRGADRGHPRHCRPAHRRAPRRPARCTHTRASERAVMPRARRTARGASVSLKRPSRRSPVDTGPTPRARRRAPRRGVAIPGRRRSAADRRGRIPSRPFTPRTRANDAPCHAGVRHCPPGLHDPAHGSMAIATGTSRPAGLRRPHGITSVPPRRAAAVQSRRRATSSARSPCCARGPAAILPRSRRGCSSVGRASASQAECRGFESLHPLFP